MAFIPIQVSEMLFSGALSGLSFSVFAFLLAGVSEVTADRRPWADPMYLFNLSPYSDSCPLGFELSWP
jgi:hypothetical protein